jgi:malate dehydrogenase
LAEGEALDLFEAGPVVGYDSKITGVTVKDGAGYENLAGSDIVIMTGGIARKPGMSRDDLVRTNQKIMHGWAEAIARYSKETILIVLSNPVDAITQYAAHVTQFPRARVIGQAGILDSARFRTFIAMELHVSVPLTELLPKDKIEALVQRTRNGGGEIVNLLKTGSAFYAPSAALQEMADAIIYDKKKVLPCTVRLDGEYGQTGVFAGVPVRLGTGGAEEIVQWKLTDDELAALQKSASAVKAVLKVMGI